MIKNIHCGQHWPSRYNEVGMDFKTWEACDVHLGQVPRLQNDHGHPACRWLDKKLNILASSPWSVQSLKKGHLVTEGDKELSPPLAPQLVAPWSDLPGQWEGAGLRGGEVHPLQLHHDLGRKTVKKNIPSNWTITSPTTSSLLYRSKERTTKCRVRICKEATFSTCFWWTLWIFNRFQINFLFAIGKFCVFKKVPVQCTCEWHTSEACQAQSLKSLTRK